MYCGTALILPVRFVAVNHKLGIGTAAELVQVHANASAVGIHSEGNDLVEHSKESGPEAKS